MDLRLRALNGFGLGARVGEKERIGDPKRWLHSQLSGGAPTLDAPEGAARSEIAESLRQFRMAGQQDNQARQEARRRLVRIAAAEHRAALTRRATSDRPFVERLVAFWSNHLCVSATAKIQVAPLAGAYEREVIRPHVLGKFEDMVLASARHPAMLFYLDNFQSIGPNSTIARNPRAQQRGLNENYARELLELHTLGVNGGYSQADVLQLARLLTGWTVSGLAPQPDAMTAQQRRRMQRAGVRAGSGNLEFVFQPGLHEPGDKTILGRKYGEGEDDGERAIRTFCRHPSTATFVATKLVTHFVSDEAPPGAVETIARTFRESEGDLTRVAAALIELPDAWSETSRKFRTPQDWLVAAWRLFDIREINEQAVGVLRQLRHPLWAPASPKGFGDTTREWADPDSLLNRAELARSMTRRSPAVSSDLASRITDVVDVAPNDPVRAMLSDSSIEARERVSLAIAGPAFQWR
jgi:uncharacterized protein (DUF1800 family)